MQLCCAESVVVVETNRPTTQVFDFLHSCCDWSSLWDYFLKVQKDFVSKSVNVVHRDSRGRKGTIN